MASGTYQFQCEDCFKAFTVQIARKDFFDFEPSCPNCASRRVKRSLHPAFGNSGQASACLNATAKFDAMYPYIARSKPRWMGKGQGVRHDSFGHPIIESKAMERNMCAGAYGERYERD